MCRLVAILAATAAVSFAADLRPGDVCAWIGAPRTGKSRALMAADDGGAFPRRVVFDPYADRDRKNARNAGTRGHVHPWPGMLVTVPDLLDHPRLLWTEAERGGLVVAPTNLEPEAVGKDFAALARLAWEVGDVDLLAEEAGLYSRHAVSMVMRLASGGGHAGVRLVLVSQSFTRLQADARRHVSAVLAFPTGAAADFDELRGLCGDGFVSDLRSLRKGDGRCAVWSA